MNSKQAVKHSEHLIYRDSSINTHIVITLVGMAMVAVGAYLTKHYYEVLYPTGLGTGSLCNINSFFNCDAATHSQISNFFGVPIAIIGVCFGIFLLAGYLFQNKSYEGTLNILLKINLAGCIILFFYSLIALGGLCPFCTLYYILSFLACFTFLRKSQQKTPSLKVLVLMALPVLLVSLAFGYITAEKEKAQIGLAKGLMQQYDKLPNLGEPIPESPYRVASATLKFADAPIRITKFSDFQCPGCKIMGETLDKVAKRYEGKVNIQYFFYPLDTNCNGEIKRPLHQYACQAAYLAACAPKKFDEIHRHIFEHQQDISTAWLRSYAKELELEQCMELPETKEIISNMLNQAVPFNIQSTPTILVNGVKIEGSIPDAQLFLILDELLSRSTQGQANK